MLEAEYTPETGEVCLLWEMPITLFASLDMTLIDAVFRAPTPQHREHVTALRHETGESLSKIVDKMEAANGRDL